MTSTGQDVLKRIDRRLRALGLSENAASAAAGMSRDAIRSVRRGIEGGRQRGISTETLEKLAPVLDTTPEWLLREAGPESVSEPGVDGEYEQSSGIPIKGWVGASSQAQYYPEETHFDDAPMIRDATKDTIALEIRGTSLGELFDRWVVYFDQVRSPVTPDLIGRTCVVGLPDGRVLVKKLKRAKDGLYDLLSNTEEPIRGVTVDWAARVKHMGPR